nr:uncharacterized protein LOC131782124 [Pocillopora verrucosa]
MDSKLTILAVFLVLLANVESRSTVRSLSSVYRGQNCRGGNLIKIHTEKCSTFSGKRHCVAKCDGSRTSDPTTRIKIESVGGRKCIQFTKNENGTQYLYALKVVNGTNVVFEESGCQKPIEDGFLFEESVIRIRSGNSKRFVYKKYNTMCLATDCDGNLSLISTTNKIKSMCRFLKLK